MTQKISPKFMFIILIIALSLIGTLYDPSIAYLFVIFVLGIFVFILFDKLGGKRTILIEKTPNRWRSFLFGTVGWVASILLTFVVLGVLSAFGTIASIGPEYSFQAGLNSVFELLIQTQQTLAFEGSQFFEFLAFAFSIPIIESLFFFLVLYEVGIEIGKIVGQNVRFNISPNKLNIWTVIIFLAISFLFAVYHLSSKGLTNTPALVSVGVFAFVSLIVVMWEGQALGALIMHIENNSVALFLVYGLIVSTPLIWGIGIGVVILILLNLTKKRLEILGG